MNIEYFKNQIKETGVKEVFNKSVKYAKNINEKINAFVTILDDFEEIASNSYIKGIPYALKDNFSTKGILTTASSNILKDYIPVFDSTVYNKLKNSGALLMGKTVLDELAMGGTGTTGHTGIVRNPYDTSRIIGGSSSGSAAAVALGIVPFAMGSDTGDSVRKPASFAGIVGFKPTYGRISRYGLFPYASSLDHVGILSSNVKDAAIITDILKGKDEKDMTTLKDDNIKYESFLENNVKGKKLCYIKEILDEYEHIERFNELKFKCNELGITLEEVSLDKKLLSSIYATYHIISSAEATSNNANLTGIIFGSKEAGNTSEEIIFNTRTKGFSELIKRRFVLGSYVLQKENQEKLFLNACRVRRLIVESINKLFESYDGLLLPAAASIAPKIENEHEILNDRSKIIENHLIIGNFGGYPSVTLPYAKYENMPLGINITCNIYEDALLLNLAHQLEKVINFERGEFNV